MKMKPLRRWIEGQVRVVQKKEPDKGMALFDWFIVCLLFIVIFLGLVISCILMAGPI